MRRHSLFLAIALVIVSIITLPRILGILNPQQPDKLTEHTVTPGETLWDISEQYMPGIDPRAGVSMIKEVNEKRDSTIRPGEVLRVPEETVRTASRSGNWREILLEITAY